MKKDIPIQKVEDIAIAMIPKNYEDPFSDFWEVWLINIKENTIKSVLINSSGYGENQEGKVETSKLRYFYEEIPGIQAVMVELIDPQLFDLTNQYWVSFSLDGYLHDKKYVFVRGSFDPTYFTNIPIVEKKGIMIL